MAKFSEVFSTTAMVLLSLLLIAVGVLAIFLGLAAVRSTGNVQYLYAAYIATWAIHVFYIGTLVRRYSRLRQQMKDLGKK